MSSASDCSYSICLATYASLVAVTMYLRRVHTAASAGCRDRGELTGTLCAVIRVWHGRQRMAIERCTTPQTFAANA